MMRKILICISLLVLSIATVEAQNISQYEYWTDDNYNNRNVVASNSNDISFGINTDDFSSGIHFLNFRAKRSDGMWGNFYRYLYYIPTLRKTDNRKVSLEYWLDDNLQNLKKESSQDNSFTLSIDISQLVPGIHFFNCTPTTNDGERGISDRYLFYVPQPIDHTKISDVESYEYWLDDNYQNKVKKEITDEPPMFSVSLNNIQCGIHYFNCRLQNERGEYGNPIREMFYIPKYEQNNKAKLTSAEYWFDDDYGKKTVQSSAETNQAFNLDISKLDYGVHFFNYRAFNDKGHTGSILRQMFYVTNFKDSVGQEPIEYEYWIDDDTSNKVSGRGNGKDYAFTIDVSNLSFGTHTFNFRAKNQLDEWGETFTESFELSEVTAIDQINYKDRVVDVYNLSGIRIKSHANDKEVKSLPRGIYIINGRKILIP